MNIGLVDFTFFLYIHLMDMQLVYLFFAELEKITFL